MIVRILTEGQYEVGQATLGRLHELDHALIDAVSEGNEPGFYTGFQTLLQTVREHGTRLNDDALEGSDLMLPPPDLSFAEAQRDFSGEGLIPD